MLLSDITTGIQTVTGTGPVTGTLDTSAMTGDFTIMLDVTALTPAGATARIAIEDTANSSAFSDAQTVVIFDMAGKIGASEIFSVRSFQVPSTRFGAANTKLRANVLALNGFSPSLSLHGYLKQ
jgi:hypothetical protein